MTRKERVLMRATAEKIVHNNDPEAARNHAHPWWWMVAFTDGCCNYEENKATAEEALSKYLRMRGGAPR